MCLRVTIGERTYVEKVRIPYLMYPLQEKKIKREGGRKKERKKDGNKEKKTNTVDCISKRAWGGGEE